MVSGGGLQDSSVSPVPLNYWDWVGLRVKAKGVLGVRLLS